MKVRVLGTVIMVVVTSLFCIFTYDLPLIGDANNPPNSHVTPRYIEKGLEETGSPNLVTGVLADYRGFDTLGETTVMFVAGTTAVLLLKKPKKLNRAEKKKGEVK